ncbi:TatD family hydrolase [Acidobacteria bacterium AH-259-O06]|nr:TatD family hydrolase [Acidobacteria bacterium AH-259-O06]
MFVDSHAHLDSPDFEPDLGDVLERATEAGLTTILTIGCVRESMHSICVFMQLLEDHKGVYGGIGVHPHDARFYQDELGEEIQPLMEHPNILGWGEIGLDFHYENSPRAQQIESFRQQLRRARLANKPVIIHSREAEEETCQILEEEFSEGPGGVLHSFTAGLKIAERCLRLGFHISFSGILTFDKVDELREVARRVPLDRLLIETDSPYLAPVPFRGKRNEPAFVVKVAEMLAQVRGKSTEEIAAITKANFERLFFKL